MLVWWTTAVECASAIARREREGHLRGPALTGALDRLSDLELGWREVQPVDRVRRTAVRLMRVHPLTAADALQLAAAIIAAEDDPGTLPFVTLDHELATAAEREGFPVVGLDGSGGGPGGS
jgi:predicted nucleic acid-binding protein